MIDRIETRLTLLWLAMLGLALEAAAQRPPASSEPTKGGMSIEKAINWLTARPGVMVAIVLIVAVLIYMYVSRSRPKA